jgi:hypothetical protein
VTTTTPVPQPVDSAARPPLSRRAVLLLSAAGLAATVAAAVILAGLVRPGTPGRTVLHTGSAHYAVTAAVDSTKVGSTGVEIDVTDRTGAAASPTAVNIQAVMPMMGHAAPPVTATPAGAGRYRAAGVPLMMAGPVELLLSIDYPGGVDHLTLPLTVGG